MRMYLDIDDNGIIQEAKFKTFGCGAAVATRDVYKRQLDIENCGQKESDN